MRIVDQDLITALVVLATVLGAAVARGLHRRRGGPRPEAHRPDSADHIRDVARVEEVLAHVLQETGATRALLWRMTGQRASVIAEQSGTLAPAATALQDRDLFDAIVLARVGAGEVVRLHLRELERSPVASVLRSLNAIGAHLVQVRSNILLFVTFGVFFTCPEQDLEELIRAAASRLRGAI